MHQHYDFEEKVEIPCGVCVSFFDELPGRQIVLEVGISIIWILIFPPGTKATIDTPFIFVEEVLQ